MLGVEDWELWKDFSLINYVNSSSIALSLDKWKIHMILIFWEKVIFYSDISENEKFTKANESIYLYCWFYQADSVTAFLRGELLWQMAAQWGREDYTRVDRAAGSQACRTQIWLLNHNSMQRHHRRKSVTKSIPSFTNFFKFLNVKTVAYFHFYANEN